MRNIICFGVIGLLFYNSTFCSEHKIIGSIKITKNDSSSLNYLLLSDSVLQYAKKASVLWFNSWNWDSKNLAIDSFEVGWKKVLDLNWSKYNPKDVYLNTFDSFFIYSNAGLTLDLYSYNTVITKEGGHTFVEFDVDSKIFVLDEMKKVRMELVTAGTNEIIEDGLWLKPNEVLLFGYVNNDTNITPFLWLFDITSKQQIFYQFNKSFKEDRKKFFIRKFPMIRLRESK